MKWLWSSEPTPEEAKAAEQAKKDREKAHRTLAEALSAVMTDATDTIASTLGRRHGND